MAAAYGEENVDEKISEIMSELKSRLLAEINKNKGLPFSTKVKMSYHFLIEAFTYTPPEDPNINFNHSAITTETLMDTLIKHHVDNETKFNEIRDLLIEWVNQTFVDNDPLKDYLVGEINIIFEEAWGFHGPAPLSTPTATTQDGGRRRRRGRKGTQRRRHHRRSHKTVRRTRHRR